MQTSANWILYAFDCICTGPDNIRMVSIKLALLLPWKISILLLCDLSCTVTIQQINNGVGFTLVRITWVGLVIAQINSAIIVMFPEIARL